MKLIWIYFWRLNSIYITQRNNCLLSWTKVWICLFWYLPSSVKVWVIWKGKKAWVEEDWINIRVRNDVAIKLVSLIERRQDSLISRSQLQQNLCPLSNTNMNLLSSWRTSIQSYYYCCYCWCCCFCYCCCCCCCCCCRRYLINWRK